MLAAAAIVAACSWNTPGADPTTSRPAATLAAMGIESPELARKIEAGEYDELVTFHRGERRAYGMSSGNAKWCDGEIDTSKWAADHEEQGRVYRVAGRPAVVWYWRCRNMSLWRAPAAPTSVGGLEVPAAGSPELIPGGPIGNGPGSPYAIPPVPLSPGPSWGSVVALSYPPIHGRVPAPPVAAVPELPEFSLICLGLMSIMAWNINRRKH